LKSIIMNISAPKTDCLRINPMYRIFIYTVIVFFCMVHSVTANNTKAIFTINDKFSDAEVAQQISNLSTDIELKYTKEVKAIINNYISSGRPGSEAILSRSNYYFPLMESIIQKHNLPEEIKYLSVIESGLRPTVRSKAGAVGLWQFISSTAKMYDLKIVSAQDDRQNLVRSTEAAMLYLNDLYNRFGDWGLAIAAYNCGPGNINKAIRKSGGKRTYWEVKKYLPKETRRYLPKFVATMYVMNYFDQYGLVNKTTDYTEYKSFGVATIYGKTSFKRISELSGLSISEIKKFNTGYKHHYIPASTRGNSLILPETYILTYLQNLSLTHQLQEVFYLKNTLFTLSNPTEIAEVLPEVENTRTEIQVADLDKIILKEIPSTQNRLEVRTQRPIIYASPGETVAVARLRKRQSLMDLMAKKNHTEATVYHNTVVNVAGVVMIKQ